MATEYKIIKIRGGLEADFYPAMLLPREMYISTDKGWTYYCYSAGNVKRFTTIEDIKNEITGVTQEIIDEITEAVEQATIYANEQGDYAKEQGDYANVKGDYAYQKGQEAQAIVDSAAPIINTNLQATYADKAKQTGENLHVSVADDALVQITELKGKSTQVITETSPSPDNPSPILSVGDEDFEIVSCGKNIAKDNSYIVVGQYTSCVWSKAELKPSTTYVISLVLPLGKTVYSNESLFELSRTIVGDGTRKSIIATTKENASHNNANQWLLTRGWSLFKNSTGITSVDSEQYLQIELGSTATDYEPYKEDRVTIDTTNQKFRGFQSGVKDGYGFKDREFGYWQRVGITTRTTSGSISGAKTNSQYMCNISPVGNLSGTTFTMPSGGVNAIVQYELATPIFTPLPEIYLKSYKGVTNVFTTAEVQPELTGIFKSELWAREYGKLDKTGDTKDNVVTFTEATVETDILSGETHDTLFGKILKSIKTFRTAIGTLSSLKTTNKSNLVAAINEQNDNLAKTIYNLSDYKYAGIASADGSLSKSNNSVTIAGYAIVTDGTFFPAQGAKSLFILPVVLRPSKQIYAPATLYSSNTSQAGFITINTDGGVNVYNRSALDTLDRVAFSVSYDI